MEKLKKNNKTLITKIVLFACCFSILMSLFLCNIGATNLNIVSKTQFVVNERSGIILDYASGEQLTNVDLTVVLQVNNRPQEQMLIYSTQHTSKVFVGDIETHYNQSTPYVFDVQVNTLYSIRYILYQYAYEDINGDIVPCGFQIYVRQLANNWDKDIEPLTKTQILQNTFTLDGVYNDTTFRITTTIHPNQVGDYVTRYNEGYNKGVQDGVQNTVDSGLSERQTAVGVLMTPLTAITQSIQRLIYSLFDNPIGWIFLGIGALLIIAVVVLGVFKFIR